MATKLEHALSLARQGFYIFRLSSNTKIPLANISWREASTRNEKTIRSWFVDDDWKWEPDFNLAMDCGKSGIFVVDVDCKDGKQGKENFAKLIAEHKLPPTYTVTTPSGGKHYYFKADRYRNSQGDKGGLAPGIDTRGDGGFVVAAGSTIDGKEYVALDHSFGDIPDLPKAWCDLMAKWKAKSVHERQSSATVSSDDPGDIAWAIDFLQRHEPAVEGAGGDHHTFVTFCKLKERGISCDTAIMLADEHWNLRCIPPWDLPDLERKAASAYKSAQNATGAHSIDAEFDMPLAPVQALKENLLRGTALVWGDGITPRDWLFGELCLRHQLSILVAPGGSGKSMFTIAMAISAATGKNILGIDPGPAKRVAIYNNEDTHMELSRRVFAVAQHYGIKREELSNLHIISGETRPLRIAKRGENSHKLKPADVELLIESVKELNIEILIVDPLAETHPAKENENEEMLEVGRMYRAVAQLGDCAVLCVHHTRKLSGASSEGHSGNLDSMRGASSLGGVARVVATFNTMNKKQAKEYGVPEEIAHRYVCLEIAKANMSSRAEGRRWYEWKTVTICQTLANPDGERVGVLQPVNLGKPKERTSEEAIDRMMADIEEVVQDEALTIGAIALKLTKSFPFYQNQQKSTVEKAIRRTFNGSAVMTSPCGTLHLDDPLTGAKTIRFERLRFSREDSSEDPEESLAL